MIAIVEILVNISFSFYLTNTYIVLITVQSRHCSKCFININSLNSQYTEISNNPYIRDKKTGTEPLSNHLKVTQLVTDKMELNPRILSLQFILLTITLCLIVER